MNTHKNAPLTPEGRARMVQLVVADGHSQVEVARRMCVSRKTVGKWVRRFREHGWEGLGDRSSRPRHSPNRTCKSLLRRIEEVRRQHRLSTPELAELFKVPTSTVWRWLSRVGLGRLRPAQSDEPARRYEREHPGDLIHVDVKKLARFQAIGHRITGDRTVKSRGAGYDFLHVAIDDHSRLAYVEAHRDEKAVTAIGFVRRAFAWYRKQGVQVKRLMSDNGSCYRSKAFKQVLKSQGVRHIYTRPYTPRTNGKAERFIGTMVREWAYSRAYQTSDIRNQLLCCWLRYYNEDRPHGSLGRMAPYTRVPGYNVLGNYT